MMLIVIASIAIFLRSLAPTQSSATDVILCHYTTLSVFLGVLRLFQQPIGRSRGLGGRKMRIDSVGWAGSLKTRLGRLYPIDPAPKP